MLVSAALISGSRAVYFLILGILLIPIGFVLAQNLHGAAENCASRWGSTQFTIRIMGGVSVLIGVIFCAGAIYHMVR